MISEGSCYTEDWNNDAENSALNHKNKLHFKMYYFIFYLILKIPTDKLHTFIIFKNSLNCSSGQIPYEKEVYSSVLLVYFF